MRNRVVGTTLLVLVSLFGRAAYAAPSDKETIQVLVVSSQVKTHGASPDVFQYTDVMFTKVNGKKIVYECDQRGDLCPVMESGKTFMATRDGKYLYFSVTSPQGKPYTVKYKEGGSW
jgi:hypothetical protein